LAPIQNKTARLVKKRPLPHHHLLYRRLLQAEGRKVLEVSLVQRNGGPLDQFIFIFIFIFIFAKSSLLAPETILNLPSLKRTGSSEP
jgi:hypothetical protein